MFNFFLLLFIVFFEVGVFSYLKNMVYYVFEIKWILVKLWIVIFWKGFFEVIVLRGEGFCDIFYLFELGIYFIVLNL